MTFGLAISSLLSLFSHAIYLSSATVSLDEREAKVEIRVFTSDLNDALYQYGTSVGSEDRSSATVEAYFSQHLVFGTNQKLTLEKMERVGESTTLIFNAEFSDLAPQLRADYLMEIFPTQQNVVTIQKQEQRNFYRLYLGHQMALINQL
ncbi:MAG: DUF6702 family protein [Reichenbachiella sp.]|uniref:DUF6702 family protein n=1 Tax=Reichenbachiella sp. TaxID=2184521 RepID=UPI003299801A